MSDQAVEKQPDPLAAIIHATWKEELGTCPHGTHLGGGRTGQPYAMCEVFSAAIMPSIMHELVPALIRAWADSWDVTTDAGEESFESHIARHVADDMEGLIVIPSDLDDWEPRFDDHPLPPLSDGGL
jgi:hypothetical protein